MAKEMRLNGVPQDEAVRKLAEAGATGPAFAALQECMDSYSLEKIVKQSWKD